MASTIAAIASGTDGAVGIVRVSGPLAEAIGRTLCHPWPADLQSHRLYLGTVRGPSGGGGPGDQALFCLMRAPRSYTGEDVLEIHAHGGAANLSQLLDAVLAAGAERAAAGEFTRRAFLAGRLDLTQAEAIAMLVAARSAQVVRLAQRQLGGELGRHVAGLRGRAADLLGQVEGALDFPEADENERVAAGVCLDAARLGAELRRLARSFADGGKALQQGVEIVLLGRPNAGKSSLVNALCGAERVVVDSAPGTTRDYVEVRTRWDAVPVTLIDTAGQRADAPAPERLGHLLGRQRWRSADLALLIVDGTAGLGEEEAAIRAALPAGLCPLTIWNKIDRQGCAPPAEAEAIACSALCGWGVAAVRERVLCRVAPQARGGEELLVLSARQAEHLDHAVQALARVEAELARGVPWDLVALDLRAVVAELGAVTGEEVSGAALDRIFANFCIGK